MFKPKDRAEAEVFAFEGLRSDVQYDVLRVMHEAGVSKAELAREMGVSNARVSQLLDDDANLTLETIAKIFVALNRKPRFVSEPAEAVVKAEVANQMAKMAAQEDVLQRWWGGGRRVLPAPLVRRTPLRFDEVRANDNFAEARQMEVA